MISWATKADPVAEITDTQKSKCKVCPAENQAHYLVEQNYFLLYWLPIFPTERVVYKICPSCSFKSKLKKGSSRLLDDYSAVKLAEMNSLYPKKMKLRYIWGWLVYLPLIGGVAYLVSTF